MVRRTKAEAEQTHNELLDAAIELFLRQGIERTSLNDIASAAGKTRGAIYWHFKNKDDVIQALWERNSETFYNSFDDLVTKSSNDNGTLEFRTRIKNMMQTFLSNKEFGQVSRIIIHNVEFTDEQSDLQIFLTGKKDDFIAALVSSLSALNKRKLVRTTLEPEIVAGALFSYMLGLLDSHFKPGCNSLDLVKHGDELIDLFLDSVFLHNNVPA